MESEADLKYEIAAPVWADFDQHYPMFESNGLFGSGAERRFSYTNGKGVPTQIEIKTLDVTWEKENVLGLRFVVRVTTGQKTARYMKFKKQLYTFLNGKNYLGGLPEEIKEPTCN